MSKRLSISQRLKKAGSLGVQKEILHDWADNAREDLISEQVPARREAAAGKFFDGLHRIIDSIVDFDNGQPRCQLCGYQGEFIDGGETCPQCKLVQ